MGATTHMPSSRNSESLIITAPRASRLLDLLTSNMTTTRNKEQGSYQVDP